MSDWKNWGKARIEPMEVKLNDYESTAIDKYRRMSEEKEKLLKDYMGNLISAGVISKTDGLTKYVSNPHVVLERRETSEGMIYKHRFCIDYRAQNRLVQDVSYHIPIMDKLLQTAANRGRYFMSFDLCKLVRCVCNITFLKATRNRVGL